jgi:uncharacterized protein
VRADAAALADPKAPALVERLQAIDWEGVGRSLSEQPYARLGPLLTAAECAQLVAAYEDARLFRSRVAMERHRFGRGDYQYFAYPLPPLVAEIRKAAYPPLARIANAWAESLGERDRYPLEHEAFRARCHAAGQSRPTPLLLHYEEGGYNALHQDLYGPLVFPLQVAVFLGRPFQDYEGGAFLLVEQRPRAQSIGEALLPGQGEAVVFTTRYRPVRSTRGFYRANVRHGVSRVQRGVRHTLGVIFHDAV